MPRKTREFPLSYHSSSFVFGRTFGDIFGGLFGGLFTGVFAGACRYDSPSLGIFRKNSCPGLASRTSLGARHSVSVCAAASSSAGTVPAVLRYDVTPITSAARITAVTPARVQTRHGRALFPSLAASAAASTRARKSAD